MNASADAPLRIGQVVLTVHDLDTVGRFYQHVVGLDRLGGDASEVRLGAGNVVLLVLRRDIHARFRSPRDAGLFHTAFLLPTRADLGRWTRYAAQERLPIQGASDHIVSEAIYLADPEGNGIEVYADRPKSTWAWADGMIKMSTEPLDTDDLMRSGGSEPWRSAPEGSMIGHIHLQVGSIAPADAFYGGVLGLKIMARYPGASFFGSGGYHHHVGANIWNSRNAAVRSGPTTGLSEFEMVAADPTAFDGVARRLAAAGLATEPLDNGLKLRDPWNIPISLTTAKV